MTTYHRLVQDAWIASKERILDGRITNIYELQAFLFDNFGLGATKSDRILKVLQGIGKIDVSEDGDIAIRQIQ